MGAAGHNTQSPMSAVTPILNQIIFGSRHKSVGGEKIWEAGKKRDPAFTCANMFWWYNMASSHDFGATPRE
jgi:hypothetical protein